MTYGMQDNENGCKVASNGFLSKLKIGTILQSVKRRLSPGMLSQDENGNFGIIFALVLPVTLLFVGGAIDYSRLNSIRSDMLESCDAAGLAIARYSETPEIAQLEGEERKEKLRAFGENFFNENFAHEKSVSFDSPIDFSFDEVTIEPQISGEIKTIILSSAYKLMERITPGMQDVKRTFSVACGNEITLSGSGRVELALVVDVSGSMGNSVGGVRKIDALRDATDSLMDVLFGSQTTSDNILIGVVPFNQFSNPGGSTEWNGNWNDSNAESVYHGDRFYHVNENGVVDTDTPVSHFSLFGSTPGANWAGCVEGRPYPLDELDVPPGSASVSASFLTDSFIAPTFGGGGLNQYEQRTQEAFSNSPGYSLSVNDLTNANNTRWVPMFAADEPDCNAGGGNTCERYGGNTQVVLTQGFNARTFFLRDFWFDHPRARGHQEGHFDNRNFIDDSQYIRPANGVSGGGQDFARYAHIVDKFRDATGINSPFTQSGNTTHGMTADERAQLEDYLESIGADGIGDNEYFTRQGYPGWWDPIQSRYFGKYNLNPSIDERTSGGARSTRGPNRACPQPILAPVDDRRDIEDYMEDLIPYGYTNSATGAIWGERLISPEAPFESEIDDDDDQWQKAVVIMTDGVNTVRYRDTPYASQLTAYGFASEERMGAGLNTSSEMRDQIDHKFLRTCQRMKDRGYLVYTIMFDLNNSSVERLYRACASSPDEPFFFNADNGVELEQAFEDIAADLVRLHVSR